MSAETRVYIRVARLHWEWIEISAMGLGDAGDRAAQLPGVATVDYNSATYDVPPESETVQR